MSRKPKVLTREFFQEQGRIGGKIGGVRAAGKMTAAERSERARKAVAAREWRPVRTAEEAPPPVPGKARRKAP